MPFQPRSSSQKQSADRNTASPASPNVTSSVPPLPSASATTLFVVPKSRPSALAAALSMTCSCSDGDPLRGGAYCTGGPAGQVQVLGIGPPCALEGAERCVDIVVQARKVAAVGKVANRVIG